MGRCIAFLLLGLIISLTSCKCIPNTIKNDINMNDNQETVTVNDYPVLLYSELPEGENIIFQEHISLTSKDIVICKSIQELYSVYIIDSYGTPETKKYEKLYYFIPSSISFDEYSILPFISGTGGSGGLMIYVEIICDGMKSYHVFEGNLESRSKYGSYILHFEEYVAQDEIEYVLNKIKERNENNG